MPPALMMHDSDPREALQKKVGDLSDIEIFGNDVLVAIYERPAKTRGGIIMTDVTRGEDVYQGKVGLVVAMGALAFEDTALDGMRCEIGDWVFLRPADGWSCTLNGAEKTPARVVRDALIRGRVTNPDAIY